MMGRIFSKIESEYDEKFPNSPALLFWMVIEKKPFLKLLKKAIERGTPVTKQEIIELIGKDVYEQEVAFYAQHQIKIEFEND